MAKKEAGSGEGFLLAWFRVDRTDGERGFFENMWDRHIKSAEWRRYAIEGRIDEEAESLHYGLLFFNDCVNWPEKRASRRTASGWVGSRRA